MQVWTAIAQAVADLLDGSQWARAELTVPPPALAPLSSDRGWDSVRATAADVVGGWWCR